jgi:hypothetical protein
MTATTPPPYTCPRCGAVSHHPKDAEQGYCGRCHAFTRVSLRLRLYVAGKLADERWVGDDDHVTEVGEEHQARAVQAERDGLRWLVEVFDPAAPTDEAFLRFGTDADGMVMPHEVTRWPWQDSDD